MLYSSLIYKEQTDNSAKSTIRTPSHRRFCAAPADQLLPSLE